MAGKLELLTPSNGKVALVGEDTATDVTVTVPAVTATVLNDQSDIEAQVKAATNATGDAPIFACRAWVNFNGTTTPPTVRGSGNVSSVTKASPGIYTVNFTTAMPDINYSTAVAKRNDNTNNGFVIQTPVYTTTYVEIQTYENSVATNSSIVSAAIFR